MKTNKYRFGAVIMTLGWMATACNGRLDLGNPTEDGGVGSETGSPNGPHTDGGQTPGSDGGQIPGTDGGRTSTVGAPGESLVIAPSQAFKVDLLFDIDNSASMGDKQALLELAIPDLVNRLINPNCVANTDDVTVVGRSVAGDCSAQAVPSSPEFYAVRDMHLGIVSSSLGSRGGDVCYATQMTNENAMDQGQPFLDGMPAVSSHTDDRGHLLGRTSTNAEAEMASPVVGKQNFIDWFPNPAMGSSDTTPTVGAQALTPATPETSTVSLETDFTNLVTGVHAFGCGVESQLESWYRFLIQPDPYLYIAPSTPAPLPAGAALASPAPAPGSWVGYDQVIIQQRHDFLRPQSLVAIIVLSDENDSEIDTRSFSGQAWHFMVSGSLAASADGTTTVPAFDPPKATSICATNPGDPGCTSCAYCSGGSPTAVCNDPNCVSATAGVVATYTSPVDWGNDVNLRHAHMKQKYGISPQYSIERYYIGLTSPTVPDRTMEYPNGFSFYQGGTAQPDGTGAYQPGDPSQLNCTNPLFAPVNDNGDTTLPDGTDMSPSALCNTAHPASLTTSRSPGLVFFMHIGGVPHQLLQAQPGVADPATGVVTCPAGTAQADCPEKDTLGQADWVSILGKGDATSIPGGGPSYDYTGIDPHMIESFQPRAPLTNPGASAMGGGPDPVNGREWTTDTSFKDTLGNIQAAHSNLPVDLEYACIFPLVDPVTGNPTPRDCSNEADYVNQEACDCSPPAQQNAGMSATPFSAASPSPVPAVCGQCTSSLCSMNMTPPSYNLQYYGKAYPTIREAELVHLMGPQGVLSSICPIHTSYAGGNTSDPVFGYRPAMSSIVNRIKTAITPHCLPERLASQEGACAAPESATASCTTCSVLAVLPAANQGCTQAGLAPASAEALAALIQADGDAAVSGKTVCEIHQLPYVSGATCAGGTDPTEQGWCYVQGAAAGASCVAQGTPQTLAFTSTVPPAASVVILQCLGQP